jgi:hypothetical protein
MALDQVRSEGSDINLEPDIDLRRRQATGPKAEGVRARHVAVPVALGEVRTSGQSVKNVDHDP